MSSRVFAVRREVIFRAWSDSAHLSRWWGPKGFTNTFHEFNMRPGGMWRFVMHGPDGVDYWNESIFVEVVPPERIVLKHLSGPVFQLTATFSDVGRKTRLTWRMLFESAEECAKVRTYAAEANEQNLDRLEAELRRMAKMKDAGRSDAPKGSREMAETFDRTVRFSTFVRAAPERVFDALATAEGLDRWFTSGCTLEPRAGGKLVFRWKDHGLEGYTGEYHGSVVEWQRPSRFSFEWPVDLGNYRTTARFSIQEAAKPHLGAGTVVALVEGTYEDSVQGLEDMYRRTAGWAEVLTLLKFHVELGTRY